MIEYNRLLQGAYDVHIHSNPSIYDRRQTDWELLDDAIKAQMGGIVLKSHESSTVERAFLLNEKNESEVKVYGGIVLNQYVGGINPWAVDAALQMGGKFVWFPTISTDQHLRYFKERETKLFNGNPTNSTTVSITENGKITNDVIEVLHLIKEHGAVLATGHLSLNDQHLLVNTAIEVGVKKILIQHADMGISKIPLKDQKEFATLGCMIEKCYLACTSDFNDLTVKEMVGTIEDIGADSCIVGTDFGQLHNIPAIQGLNTFVTKLVENGLPETAVEKIVKNNAQSFLE